jgi:hypothetical protein
VAGCGSGSGAAGVTVDGSTGACAGAASGAGAGSGAGAVSGAGVGVAAGVGASSGAVCGAVCSTGAAAGEAGGVGSTGDGVDSTVGGGVGVDGSAGCCCAGSATCPPVGCAVPAIGLLDVRSTRSRIASSECASTNRRNSVRCRCDMPSNSCRSWSTVAVVEPGAAQALLGEMRRGGAERIGHGTGTSSRSSGRYGASVSGDHVRGRRVRLFGLTLAIHRSTPVSPVCPFRS